MVEKAGIVSTIESKSNPGQFFMHIVQDDTVDVVREIVENPGSLMVPDTVKGLGSGVPDKFASAEEIRARAKLGSVPAPMKEAEDEILRALRETK